MEFTVEKDQGTIPFVLSQILDTVVNGVTLSDPDLPDNPIIYANAAFERITGYAQDEILGRNCRFLQGEDQGQPEVERIRAAIRERGSVTVTLRNYRKDGTLFHNRFTVRPLFDPEGALIYFLGIQYDVSDLVLAEQTVSRLTAQLELPPPVAG